MLSVAATRRGNSKYAKRATMRIKRLELRMRTRGINFAHARIVRLRYYVIILSKNKIEHKN